MQQKHEWDDATEVYIQALRETQIYKNYRAALERVRQYPELKMQLDHFRNRNFEFQMQRDIDFDKFDAFEKEYEGFRENPLVEDFLAAELAFCRMIQRASLQVTEALDFDFALEE